MIKRTTIVFFSLLIFLTGCSLSPTPQATPTAEEQPIIIPELNGSFWIVASINGNDPIRGTSITLTFVDGWVTGNSGCNTYGGEYAANDQGELDVLFLIRQEVSCLEPPGIMEQEDMYLDILEGIEQYGLVEGYLRLDASDDYLLLGQLAITE
ncbi:MAG: META domain-containing protein [Anaerolineales bacterium]|nr:META domain-containing protein [Anaerolineales bacterium]